MNLSILATELNLTSIAVVKAAPLEEDVARIKSWIEHGYNGKMAWLSKDLERRINPKIVMPDCESVIVCTMKYEDMPIKGDRLLFRKEKSSLSPLYLLHEDYHRTMMERLQTIAKKIGAEHKDAVCRCYVDTGPIIEKAWATRADLGFIGKNTLLISPTHGSQMALGVILTDAPSPQPSPSRGEGEGGGGNVTRCDNCTACIDACPTKALIAPYTLDARKCISYKFFIEKKEGGCDICQDVCPYNKGNI